MGIFLNNSFAALPPMAPGQDLTAQAERFQQEYSTEKRAREQKIQKALIEYVEREKEIASPEASFVLHEVHLTGTTIFSIESLSFIWTPYLKRSITFTDLNKIVKMIKRVYKDFGYLTTTAYIPPQDIKDGVVEIHVVEGKLGKLNVEGNKWVSTPSIAKYFHTYTGEAFGHGRG